MLRAILTLLSGSSLSTAITIAASPFLTRLYAPEDFGLVAAVLSVSSVLSIIIPGRFPLAIPLADNEEDAKSLFYLATLMCLILSPLMAAAAVLMGQVVLAGTSAFVGFLYVLAATFLASQGQVFGFWRNYRKRFAFAAKNGVLRSILATGSQFALSGVTAAGMLLGNLFGGLAAMAVSVREIVVNDRAILQGMPGRGQLLDVFKRYRDFPIFSMPQGLVASVSKNSVPLIIAYFSGAAMAGQYWLVYRVLAAPIDILGGAYKQVILSHLGSQKGDDTENLRLIRRHSMVMGLVSLPPVAVILYAGPDIFPLVFGDQWLMAGVFSGWMIMSFTLSLVAVPAVCLLQLQGRHRHILIYDIVSGALRLAGLTLGLMFLGEVEAIQIFALTTASALAVLLVWTLR